MRGLGYIYKFIGLIQVTIISIYLVMKGYKKVRPFLFKSWHECVSLMLAVSPDGGNVFIKTSGIYKAAEREYAALSRLNKEKENYYPKVLNNITLPFVGFVIMEYVSAKDMNSRLPKRAAFEKFCIDVTAALDAHGIIHRDIRPENILVTSDNHIYLIDFGWAVIDNNSFGDRRHMNAQRALGTNYKPDMLEWNDSYSLRKIYLEKYATNINLESKSFKIT